MELEVNGHSYREYNDLKMAAEVMYDLDNQNIKLQKIDSEI